MSSLAGDVADIGVMFPGQGTQRLGMGRHLERGAPGAAVFDVASEVTGRDVRALCFTGPAAVQTRTENAQVAVFTCNAAALALLRDAGAEPVVALGHSVGELNALHAAGVLDLDEAVRLVAARGALMGAITRPGAMLAVLGLDLPTVVALCEQARATAGAPVVAALLNGPANVVASGAVEAVEALTPLVLAAGAVKATQLVVSHAFHSPLMADAVDAWRDVVAAVPLAPPRIPVLLNTTGRAAAGVDDIRAALVDQLTGPVRWVEDVRAAVSAGARGFVEAGDSKVLGGLVRAIDPQLPTWTMNDPRTVRRLRETFVAVGT
jgi:[acyl-carrier-protein] S-malonyltransferase